MVREIGRLTQLRRLEVAKLRSGDGEELCSSIAKLTYLRSLKIIAVEEREKMDLDYDISSTSLSFLSRLDLSGCIEKVPRWIESLSSLTRLALVWSKLKEDPLKSLQHLPNLASLWIHDAYEERLRFEEGGFKKLKRLSLAEFKWLKRVVVEKGAMPGLVSWDIWDCKVLEEMPEGVEHLRRLEDVKFGNMSNEFVEQFVEEKTNEGDKWRLAHVPVIHFGVVKDGFWKFNLHFHK